MTYEFEELINKKFNKDWCESLTEKEARNVFWTLEPQEISISELKDINEDAYWTLVYLNRKWKILSK